MGRTSKSTRCSDCSNSFDPTENTVAKKTAMAAGGAAGAKAGSLGGLALGPLGAISGTVPGAIAGGITGLAAGKKFVRCPSCDTIQTA